MYSTAEDDGTVVSYSTVALVENDGTVVSVDCFEDDNLGSLLMTEYGTVSKIRKLFPKQSRSRHPVLGRVDGLHTWRSENSLLQYSDKERNSVFLYRQSSKQWWVANPEFPQRELVLLSYALCNYDDIIS